MKHEHPVEYEWHESGDHETDVNHTVGREGEPAVLSPFGDRFALGLLGGGNGTTGIFCPDANTEEESKTERRGSKRQPSRAWLRNADLKLI